MPARVLHQDGEIKDLFRAKIREKVEREKLEMHERINDTVPSWLRWAVRPLAERRFDAVRARDEVQGRSGERSAFLRFWLLLPNTWTVINDVVLEPEPGEFVQIDHVLAGPPGVVLVETKAWEVAFRGYNDVWKRKGGNTWVRCESPTKQNLRHKRLFLKWLAEAKVNLPGHPKEYVAPVVLFTRTKWLKAQECSMPVFDSGTALAFYLRRQGKRQVLSSEQVDAVASAIAGAKPCGGGQGRGQGREGQDLSKWEYAKVLGG